MKYPNLKLKIDIKYDIDNATEMVWYSQRWDDTGIGIKWFLPEEIRFILSGKFSKKEQVKILEEYVRNIYEIRKDEIKKYFGKVKNDWGKVENNYYEVMNMMFSGYPWPKGNYRGYATIFKMYTRNIEDKSFIFPYIHDISNYPVQTIAHEMMHFIFFDFIKKNYGLEEDDEIKGKPKAYVWQISEVFNNVMEDWGPYKKVIIGVKPDLYHGRVKMFERMKKQWAQKQDVKRLLDQWFL